MSNVLISILFLALSAASTTHSSPTDVTISFQREATFSNETHPPPLPSSFYGVVTLNGTSPPATGVVTARIGDEVVAHTTTFVYAGIVYYRIDVPGDDPSTPEIEGGAPGAVIIFTLADVQAAQTAIWQSGTNTRLDLEA